MIHFGALAQVFGTVDGVDGAVSIIRADGIQSPPVLGQKLLVGQTVQTEQTGELHVVTEDCGLLAVRGALRSISGWIGKINPRGYRVTTPTVTIGIRGTDHETTVTVLEPMIL